MKQVLSTVRPDGTRSTYHLQPGSPVPMALQALRPLKPTRIKADRRGYPKYKPGMSTAEYVALYEDGNGGHLTCAGFWQTLNTEPAAGYMGIDSVETIEDAPDILPAADPAPDVVAPMADNAPMPEPVAEPIKAPALPELRGPAPVMPEPAPAEPAPEPTPPAGSDDPHPLAGSGDAVAPIDSITLRAQLVAIEAEILAKAPARFSNGRFGADIEAAARSRAVSSAMRSRRLEIRSALRAAVAREGAAVRPETEASPTRPGLIAPAAPSQTLAQIVAEAPSPCGSGNEPDMPPAGSGNAPATVGELVQDLQVADAAVDAAVEARADLDELGAIDAAATAARDALVDRLAEPTGDAFGLRGGTPDGRVLILAESAQHPGAWQLTRFDRQGEPWGDSQYTDKRRAIGDLLREIDLATLRVGDGTGDAGASSAPSLPPCGSGDAAPPSPPVSGDADPLALSPEEQAADDAAAAEDLDERFGFDSADDARRQLAGATVNPSHPAPGPILNTGDHDADQPRHDSPHACGGLPRDPGRHGDRSRRAARCGMLGPVRVGQRMGRGCRHPAGHGRRGGHAALIQAPPGSDNRCTLPRRYGGDARPAWAWRLRLPACLIQGAPPRGMAVMRGHPVAGSGDRCGSEMRMP